MSESEFLVWIRRQLDTCHVTRIESSTERGIPDLCVCSCGIDLWVEAKVETSAGVLIRPEQFAWGMRAAAHERRVCVLSMHHSHGILKLWRYPDVGIIPRGKYLRVTNNPRDFGAKNAVNLHKFLFT